MAIIQRRYKMLADFHKVSQFLDDQYNMITLNSYLLRPFFEYAHTHPAFDHSLTHRFGLWEEGDELLAIVCYEMQLGEAFLSVKSGYESLLPEMLMWAEKELSIIKDQRRILHVWVTDKEVLKIELLKQHGYAKIASEAINIFSYDNEFCEVEIPESYSVISLEDENDVRKIHRCLWTGFDHGPDPDDDLDCRLLMQSGPNFRKDLTTIMKAPNSDYACFAGMWLNEANQYAYLEPLATAPEYRRKGLACIAVTEAMKKTKKLGAKYCFGGEREFYRAIGFETLCHRELWKREW